MRLVGYIVFGFFLLQGTFCFAQGETLQIERSKDTLPDREINPLAPAKAAFYSAVLPGLGQAYNKKYWKIPLVYGAIGASIYYYTLNNNRYQTYRNAYKDRLAGIPNEAFDYLDNARLIQAQQFYQRNRDLSLLCAIGFYVLNIIDANVDAHLGQFNVNDNLSFKPELYSNGLNYRPSMGVALNYTFK